jgi:hypothetical protein
MKRATSLLLLLPVLCAADVAEESIEEPREEFIQLPLTLGGEDYMVEALQTFFGYFGWFEEIELYRLDSRIEGGRELIEVYQGEIDGWGSLIGEGMELRDVTGGGDLELVVRHNSGGNDALVSIGLFVLRPTPDGFVELFATVDSAPVIADQDGDGDEEIALYSAYQSSFLWPRLYRAGYVNRLLEWRGEAFVDADPADYREFFIEEVAWRESLYREGLQPDAKATPGEILRDGQAVLAQLAVAGLDEEYAVWWESQRETLRRAVEAITTDDYHEDGDWDEVYADFHSAAAFRSEE